MSETTKESYPVSDEVINKALRNKLEMNIAQNFGLMLKPMDRVVWELHCIETNTDPRTADWDISMEDFTVTIDKEVFPLAKKAARLIVFPELLTTLMQELIGVESDEETQAYFTMIQEQT